MELAVNGWGVAGTESIRAVLNSVHRVFQTCFGESMNHQQLVVAHHDSGPVTQRKPGIILLSAKDLYWCQYAYQFAHEYCHFQIRSDVAQHVRWFEEALCELASYYFLPLVAKQWEVAPPYPGWASYAPNFISYVNRDKQKATPFNLDFSTNTETLEYLIQNEYDREKNAYVAIMLAPIFQENPTLWSVIHYIADIPEGLSFAEFLRHWRDLSPEEYHTDIERIAAIFSITL